MPILQLKSDIETITFAAGSYQLMDDTLSLEDPEIEDVRSSNNLYPGRDLRYMDFKSRTIAWNTKITGANDTTVINNAAKIHRMIAMLAQNTYINGGSYDESQSFSDATEGNDTGDQGVMLYISMDSGTQSVKVETDGDILTPSIVYAARVISGRMISEDSPFKSVRRDQNGDYFRIYEIELEIEPFLMRRSRIVGEATEMESGPVSPDESGKVNRMFITSGNIPGDAPALTRITTQIDGGQGVVIARDAGISILNCTSFPVYTKAVGGDPVANDMFCYGDTRSAAGGVYIVKISVEGTPDSFQWNKNGGAFSSSIQIVANTPTKLGADNVWVYFWTSTGHNINDEWEFKNNQAYIVINDTTDLYPLRETVYSELGLGFANCNIVIPPGCKSKYKVYASFNPGDLPSGLEFKLSAYFLGFTGPSGGRVATVANEYDWVRMPPGASYVDLGVIDLTPDSTPFLLHPQTSSEMQLQFLVRSDEEVDNPADLMLRGVYLVPCQDEFAYMHVVWKLDGFGREVFCNYDPAHPYVAEVSANYFDEPFSIANAVPLDATYAGNIITLIPGVHNTLLFIPIFSANSSDWRMGTFPTNITTQEVYVACRPRYLYF